MTLYAPIKNIDVKRTQLFINNEYVNSSSGKTFETVNPTTEEVVCQVGYGGFAKSNFVCYDVLLFSQVQEGDKADVDKAVAAAKAAMKRNSEWRKVNPADRGILLNKMADIIERDIVKIASVEVLDNGKPFQAAIGDIKTAASCFRFYAGFCDKIEGRTLAMPNGKFAYTRYEPVGVVGAITPWNFPFALACIKTAHALGAGNALVLKPAEQTPLTALMLGDVAIEAGVPAGKINEPFWSNLA